MAKGDLMHYFLKRSFSVTTVNSAFVEERNVDFYFNGEFHDFWEVVYVASGQIGVTEDERIYELEAGDIIFHRPMEFHKVWSRGNKKPRVYTMSFKTEGALPENLGDGIIHLNPAEASTFVNIFSDGNLILNKDSSHDTILEQKFSCALESFIIYLSYERTVDTNISQTADALRYSSVINVMRCNLSEDLSVEDIARLCHMSPSTMKYTFAKFSDCGVRKHFVRMKIAASVPLLKNGTSVAEISKRFSFSSQNYFAQVFKAEMGVSPMEYKRNFINKLKVII